MTVITVNKYNVSQKILDFFEKDLSNIYQSEPRTGQIQMALDIANFLYNDKKKIMFVESPVGTGKTLGTLIPSILNAHDKGKKIVYATATKNLQSQIMIGKNSESSILSRINLLNKSESVLAMGQNNYFCKSMYNKNQSKFTEKQKDLINKFIKDNKYGTLNELENSGLTLEPKQWNLLSLQQSRNTHCIYQDCPGHKYRKKFKGHQLLTVTNHNLLIQSNINSIINKRPVINNNPGIIVIDEAHDFESNFLSCINQSLPITKIKDLFYKHIKHKIYDFDNFIKELTSIIEINNVHRGQIKFNKSLKNKVQVIREDLVSLEFKSSKKSVNRYELEMIQEVLSQIINKNYTSWISIEDECIHTTTNDFTNEYKQFLLNLSKNNKLIFISGTLTTQQKNSDKENEISLDWKLRKNEFLYKSYKNQFDLKKQVFLYLPTNIDDANSKFHQSQVDEITDELIQSLKDSGILILCTSYESMNHIYTRLNKTINKRTILGQMMMSVDQLSKEFKSKKRSILVGSGSFFSGFSVPGKSLSGLIIDRLPYPVPDDPLLRLKTQNCEQNVKKQIINQMMLKKLEQGLGRLIRTDKDYGIATIVDPRIKTRHIVSNWLKNKGYTLETNIHDYNDKKMQSIVNNRKKHKYNRDNLIIPSIIYVKSIKNRKKIINNPTHHTLEEQKAWTKQKMKELRSKHTIKIRCAYTTSEKCYQTLVNALASIDAYYYNSSILQSFPFCNDMQRNNFEKRIIPTVPKPVQINK